MARNVFFSFHYQRDVFRVNQIRNIPGITGVAAAGFRDSSLWERSRSSGDNAIYRLIDNALNDTSVTVVCIGSKTAGRKFINYEIRKSLEQNNGVIGVRINHLRGHTNPFSDIQGEIPSLLKREGCKIYTYENSIALAAWIEAAAKRVGR